MRLSKSYSPMPFILNEGNCPTFVFKELLWRGIRGSRRFDYRLNFIQSVVDNANYPRFQNLVCGVIAVYNLGYG